jgi:hypothetical protein
MAKSSAFEGWVSALTSHRIAVVSSAFDCTLGNTFIGVSFNGGASFSGTNTVVEAELKGF